ncbi:AraC family transcriptional regulator [Sphingosinicella sp. BN140058]|uniref:helix-turn-helix transcriptional regulator n=1 Tax=Sphingosinicella sp. BN140058 TaxID=1892855 RepID=UPI001011E5B8|nr:AraC family transcriptional regulator [Sphingosinicella sp. BN140058]QAY78360.1 helix-turn-helix domain-containing protein [Sphingosinicella sp. BN140058]
MDVEGSHMPEGAVTVARVSTRALDRRTRQEEIREFYGRIGMGLDLESRTDAGLEFEAATLILPSLSASVGSLTPVTWTRRADLMADGRDDLCISWIAGGHRLERPGAPDLQTAPGAACIMALDRRFSSTTTDGSWTACIQIARDLLVDRVPDLDDVPLDRIDRTRPEARLLLDYLWSVTHLPIAPDMAKIVSGHLVDLVALALGAGGDSARGAQDGGARAARLLSVKRYIARNLHLSTLSARTAGQALGIGPRYVRSLFADEGTSFSDYVAERRLVAIRSRIADPAEALRPIGDIAAELGFPEPSTFYRRFKGRFGITPSELRRG